MSGTRVAHYHRAKAKQSCASEPQKAGSRPMRITIAPEIIPGTHHDANAPRLSAAPAMSGLLRRLDKSRPGFAITPAALHPPPQHLILAHKPTLPTCRAAFLIC